MIDSFTGKYFFLSNFYNCYLKYNGRIYCSSEAAYQAAKTYDENVKAKIAMMGPADAQKAGQEVELIVGWDERKDKIMFDVLYEKFTQNDSMRLKQRLLETGDEKLVIVRTKIHDIDVEYDYTETIIEW